VPRVPEGEKLDFGSVAFREFEEIGAHLPTLTVCHGLSLGLSSVLRDCQC
jgi:hypothetical protein